MLCVNTCWRSLRCTKRRWLSSCGTSSATSGGVNWLRDLLTHDLPNTRILSWDYDANTHSSSRVSL
ncbi:hypothetical protein EJ02DRAFT_456325 [Clathrospora elynae]|uniref:Uncharacterized protein n=1 Tax=Clathrospora elynae TaxID=706981 RepID=A0A6A5SKA2_9PLEO|nr:hypothetical protein EJ02DRAFT_456325 [Clathrospora elynae]